MAYNSKYTGAEVEDLLDSIGNCVTDTQLQNTLNDYAKTSDVPTKTSELENDSDFITSSAIEDVVRSEVASKIVFVEELPSNPESNVLYLIPEE